MKRTMMNGSALAVGLLLAACGNDKGPQTQKITTGTNLPVTGRVETPPAPLRIRNLDADAALVTAMKSVDTRFTKEANCVQLQGESPADAQHRTPVLFGGVSCPAKASGLEGKSIAFRLEAEPADVAVAGKKEEKPTPKQAQPPKDRLYYLVLKGTPAKSKQEAAIPDTRVGEFMVRYVAGLPKQEPVGKGKQEAVGQGKPQETPVGQGQGKPAPVGQGQGQQPAPVGKAPAPTYREELVLTKLCSDNYLSVCKVEMELGQYRKLALTKLPEAPASSAQKGKQEIPVGQGKPVAKPTTPAPQNPAPQSPAPAPKPEQGKPVGGAPVAKPTTPAPQAPAPAPAPQQQQGPKPK